MADKAPEQEPSIEEILASIRQIISDDDKEPQDEPAPEVVSAPPAPEPEPEPEPVFAPEPEPELEPEPEDEEEDVLELTEPLIEEEEPIEVVLQDIEEDFTPPPAPPAPPAPQPEPSPAMQAPDSNILNDRARKSAISSMAKLAGNMPINRANHGLNSITLEDLVREMLNPMLSDWLNSNLPPMVERIVQKELEKLARQALDV